MKNTTIPYMLSDSCLTLFFPGKAPKPVNSDHANFSVLVAELNKENHDIPKLEELSSIENAVRHYMGATTAGSNMTITDGEVFYRGNSVHNVVVDKILAFMSKGHNYQPLVNFLERLLQNPSKNSVDQLYAFLENGNMPLTPEGHFLGYKGVGEDYWSKTGNCSTVVLQGEVDSQGRILNKIGAKVEVQRNSVCDNPDVGCAEGVHVGSFEYARGWSGSGGRLLLVKVDPAQVVSVPHCCSHQKLRCCFYEVVDEITDAPKPIEEEIVTQYTQEDIDDSYVDGLKDGGYCEDGQCDFDEGFDAGSAHGYADGVRAATKSAKASAQHRGGDGRFKKKNFKAKSKRARKGK